jgi:hypothetical protein
VHLGWDDVVQQCTTHSTEQEILKNRLLCVLLNKLATNYYNCVVDWQSVQVRMDDTITKPSDLIKARIDMGHRIDSRVRLI